jgi:hypothetical protein
MRLIVGFLLLGAPLAAADFTVHEWGTFTSIVGSDGRQLSGLEVEEDSLPPFVGSFGGFAPFNKGWDRPVAGVTVKMETPVLYFYAAEPLSVRVAVGFHGGSISQWYPERSGGEQMPTPADAELARLAPVDFSHGHEGSAVWQVEVLPRDTTQAISAPRDWETPQWPRARVAAANRIRGSKGEVEDFIFYRGLGNFPLPLKVICAADGRLTLSNRGADDIPFVWVYRKEGDRAASQSWFGALAAGASRVAAGLRVQEVPFAGALTAAGLTADEAQALANTWRESYFDRPGLRVFWIVPRAFTDSVLPLEITPWPAQLARVLVGRTEVMTPAFETTLVRDFNSDGGKRWMNDRYFRAYLERVRQLRGAPRVAAGLPGATTFPPPPE